MTILSENESTIKSVYDSMKSGMVRENDIPLRQEKELENFLLKIFDGELDKDKFNENKSNLTYLSAICSGSAVKNTDFSVTLGDTLFYKILTDEQKKHILSEIKNIKLNDLFKKDQKKRRN